MLKKEVSFFGTITSQKLRMFSYLNDLSSEMPLRHISGTDFVFSENFLKSLALSETITRQGLSLILVKILNDIIDDNFLGLFLRHALFHLVPRRSSFGDGHQKGRVLPSVAWCLKSFVLLFFPSGMM